MLICSCIVMPCVSIRFVSTSFIRVILLLCVWKSLTTKYVALKKVVYRSSWKIILNSPDQTRKHWSKTATYMMRSSWTIPFWWIFFQPKPTFWTPKISRFCIYVVPFPKKGPPFRVPDNCLLGCFLGCPRIFFPKRLGVNELYLII